MEAITFRVQTATILLGILFSSMYSGAYLISLVATSASADSSLTNTTSSFITDSSPHPQYASSDPSDTSSSIDSTMDSTTDNSRTEQENEVSTSDITSGASPAAESDHTNLYSDPTQNTLDMNPPGKNTISVQSHVNSSSNPVSGSASSSPRILENNGNEGSTPTSTTDSTSTNLQSGADLFGKKDGDGHDLLGEYANNNETINGNTVLQNNGILEEYRESSSSPGSINVNSSIAETTETTEATEGAAIGNQTDNSGGQIFPMNGNSSSSFATSLTQLNESATAESASSKHFSSEPDQGNSVNSTTANAVEATSESNPNSVTQNVDLGNNQRVTFRDISDITNSTQSVQILLDKPSYSISENATITIKDQEANLDPNQVNSLLMGMNSTSDRNGIVFSLKETGPDTGLFEATISFVSGNSSGNSLKTQAGDKVRLFYIASHARLTAVLDDVITAGTVEVTDYFLPPTESIPFTPIGGAAQLSMQGASVGENGKLTITMSYANADLGGQHEDELLIFYGFCCSEDGELQWFNLRNFEDQGINVSVNLTGKTVTASIPVSGIANAGGIFMLGVDPGGGGGIGGGFGSTGGPALGGTGVVLDFIAPIVDAGGGGGNEPPSPPPSSPPILPIQESEADLLLLTDNSALSTNETANQIQTSAQAFPKISSGPIQTVTRSSSQIINITKMVPGVGPVLFELVGLTTPDIKINIITSNSDLALLGLKASPDFPGTLVANVSGSNYTVVGKILNITSEKLAGEAELTIPYDNSLYTKVAKNFNAEMPIIKIRNQKATTEVDLLHFTGQKWEIVTSEVGQTPHSVTGKVSSLGPVVAAVRVDS